MRNLLLAMSLCFALPALAQQTPPAANPPAQQAPTLEQPGVAEPEPETPAKPAVKPTPKPAAKPAIDPNSGKTVEEIIARVNNEIITKSEYDRALTTAEDDAKSEC